MRRLILLLLLLPASVLYAADPPYGQDYRSLVSVKSFTQKDSVLNFTCLSDKGDTVFLRIDLLNHDMFRLRCSLSKITPRPEYVVIKNDWPAPRGLSIQEKPDKILVGTGRLKLTVTKSPVRLTVSDREDRPILQQSPIGIRLSESASSDSFVLLADEHFFGFGAGEGQGGRAGFEGESHNRLDKRNQKISIKGRRVAFFMSTKGYGIYLNSLYPYDSSFRMGSAYDDRYSFHTNDPQLDYFFFYGPDFKNVLDLYTSLTGRAPLVPKWGFGTRQAGYWDQNEVMKYAKEYRDRDIPCDLIHIDSGWIDKGSDYQGHGICYGNDPAGYVDFKFDSRQFPNPKQMLSNISELGFKFSLWETALVNPGTGEFYKNAAENNLFMKNPDGSVCLVAYHKRGPAAVPDFSNPKTVQWWKAQHKPLIDIGVDAFKLDITGDLRTAENAVFFNGRNLNQQRILHRLLNLKTTFDAVTEYSNRRGMIYSSIATAGTQRYPLHWSGDYMLTYDALAEMVKSAQNMGMSGFAYYAPDIPGARGLKDAKLFIRWSQFGLVAPVCQCWYHLPWEFGPDAEKIYQKYAKLHYRLLPYYYSYAHIANQTGLPIIRAMVFEYQNDPQVYDKDLQFLLGKELLIAPVCTESNTRQIYLPAGGWFDYATGKKYQGPQNIIYHVPLERIPIFVKEGAIIPLAPEANYIDEKPIDQLTLDIYPSSSSYFMLFEDDGISYDYQKDIYSVTGFTCMQDYEKITIDIAPAKGLYKDILDKSYILKINNITHPEKILTTEKALSLCTSFKEFEKSPEGFCYVPEKNILYVKLGKVSAQKGQTVYLQKTKSVQ